VPQLLKPLVHVDAAWKEADGPGNAHLDDGIPSYLYNDIHVIRTRLREALGTDLTKFVAGIPTWHTGNAVDLDGEDYRERQPWVWDDEVQAGRSAGKGRSEARERRMSWSEFMTDFVNEHWYALGPDDKHE
jgi:hypothetical protein